MSPDKRDIIQNETCHKNAFKLCLWLIKSKPDIQSKLRKLATKSIQMETHGNAQIKFTTIAIKSHKLGHAITK